MPDILSTHGPAIMVTQKIDLIPEVADMVIVTSCYEKNNLDELKRKFFYDVEGIENMVTLTNIYAYKDTVGRWTYCYL